MEVAGHWRREWAGTAEYGKVTEGGVTRRIARAMEVVHASAPGAKMRVMRAAYHSSAGSGAPAASFLMHSSHSVISSGFNLLEPPSLPSKPLEISSTPLDSSPERNTDTENYKVTEPDDFDISEPSKWKSSTHGTVRMPSEESSSTDNASIIDLDARHKNLLRKYSYDSENSDIPTYRKSNTRMSPLLDEPEALSTLKYKSLLSGTNNDWNNRRKSYSFEHTYPIYDSFESSNDTLAMESSTDSGICKSTELFNDIEERCNGTKSNEKRDGNFSDWLSKNRSGSYRRTSHTNLDYDSNKRSEDSISLQSKGKVSITVPVEVADDYQYNRMIVNDEESRKAKKVEFCKTELHFAPETGTVNIIATDEKPPPSSDFRKRKSAFVPINGTFDKPITLFRDNKKDLAELVKSEFNNELNELDENTAATKSILKNKIPKPKPYLLGENMDFGPKDDSGSIAKNSIYDTPAPLGVSLINKQLHERFSDEIIPKKITSPVAKNTTRRTTNTSPTASDKLNHEELPRNTFDSNYVRNRILNIQTSPIAARAKTRQLRESDLTYFGINKTASDTKPVNKKDESKILNTRSSIDDFHSVRLVQKISNSVCNSEAESEDTPEYQNIPLKSIFEPVPKPRTKYSNTLSDKVGHDLHNISDKDADINIRSRDSRRSRAKKQEETIHAARSISAPPKNAFYDFVHPSNDISSAPSKRYFMRSPKIQESPVDTAFSIVKGSNTAARQIDEPTYVNYILRSRYGVDTTSPTKHCSNHKQEKSHKNTGSTVVSKEVKPESVTQRIRNFEKQDKENIHLKGKAIKTDVDTDSLEKKPARKHRTEKLATPEFKNETIPRKNYDSHNGKKLVKESRESRNTSVSRNSHRSKQDSRSTTQEVNKIGDKKDQNHPVRGDNATYLQQNVKETKTRKPSPSPNTRKPVELGQVDNTISSKIKPKNNPSSRSDGYKTSQRSKYIINYDDKNGTVTSVNKVKPDSGSTRKKRPIKDKIREIPKDSKIKHKSIEKTALLQSGDNHWDQSEMNYADRKWKRRMHVQRSCELL